MSDKEKRRIERNLTIVGFLVLLLMVAYMVYCGAVLKKMGVFYAVVISCGLLVFWILTSVLSPILTKEKDGWTTSQADAYKKYALLTLVGYAGLAYFAIGVNNSTGLYGALVYAATMMFKKRFRDEYMGTAEEEAGVPEESDVPEEPETLQTADAAGAIAQEDPFLPKEGQDLSESGGADGFDVPEDQGSDGKLGQ